MTRPLPCRHGLRAECPECERITDAVARICNSSWHSYIQIMTALCGWWPESHEQEEVME